MSADYAGSWRALIAGALLALVAWFSYQSNLLGVVNERTFGFGSSISERLVIDGMAEHDRGNTSAVPMGRYATGSTNVGSGSGEYRPYLSQYGLQGELFGALHRGLGLTVEDMRALNSALLALVVGAFCVVLARDFGLRAALAFSVPLAVSPLLVIYAHDLYWVSWTWLLPALLAFAFGASVYKGSGALTLFLLAFGAAMLLKLLCGYEYLTTVALAATAPVAYHGLRSGRPFSAVLGRLVLMGLATVVAFAIAVGFHATRFGSLSGGLAHIGALAEKRLYSTDPVAASKEACADDFWQDAQCESVYIESLNAGTGAVLAKYLAPKYMLPWFSRWESFDPMVELKAAIESSVKARSPQPLMELVRKEGVQAVLPYVPRVLSALFLAILVVGTAIRILRAGDRRVPLAAMVLLALLAPLSWFVAAKGHSYVHVELNSALWYVIFIPTALAVLSEPKRV